jgi:flavodoxin
MSTNIIYFTRSGKTKSIADELGSQLKANIYEVTDDKNWQGIFGYIKGGFYASSNKQVKINIDAKAFDADKLIILTPLWAGGPTPAIRTLLKEHSHRDITVVFTNDGSDVNKAYVKTENLFPNIKNFYGITKKLNNKDDVLKEIIKSQQ